MIIFVSLVGYPPFIEEDQRVLFRNIRLGEYCFFDEDWVGSSKESHHIISRLLVVDPDQGLSASQAIRHECISGIEDKCLSSRDISKSIHELRRSILYFDDENQPENINYQSSVDCLRILERLCKKKASQCEI